VTFEKCARHLCLWLLLNVFSLAGCSSCRKAEPAAAPAGAEHGLVFFGMCDASGAVPLSASRFAVADDEDNVLRVYDARQGGSALSGVDISGPLGIPLKGKRERRAPEIDIEAAVKLGETAFWIGSHGRSSAGKLKQERLRLFATALSAAEAPELRGRGYERLLSVLIADPRYAPFELAAAAERAPKESGGLNIEGLSARREGGLWVGFRSPLVRGKALLAALLNPEQVVKGEDARLGDPALLALDGLGVRDLAFWRDRYWILAGASGSDGPASALYRWQGRGDPVRVEADLRAFNPEAIVAFDGQDRLLLLSDDGTVEIDGTACKDLEDSRRRRFRATWVTAAE
jgi:hypothetical protein